MLHALYNQVNRINSWHFLVGNQTSTFLLVITCVSDVQMSNASPFYTSTFKKISNDIKNATSHWVLTPWIALWSFGNPLGFHLPKWELPWEWEGSLPHTPSHFLTLLGVCDVTPGLLLALTPRLPLGSQPCNLFALVASPKLGLWHPTYIEIGGFISMFCFAISISSPINSICGSISRRCILDIF